MQNRAIRDQIKEIFSAFWKDFKDPRSSRNQKHLFVEILFAAFCAMICNADGWSEMEAFSDEFLDFLREFFPYENGVPSDDTFRRVLSVLNPEHFQATFRKCMEPLIPLLAEKKFAIDGKVSRGSVQIINQGKQSVNIVSVVAAESGLVLTQEKVANKSNEITAIPTLLEILDLKNATITIDAMGCQYKIADQIVSGGGNYVLALKGNQENLLKDVKLIFATEDIHQKCNFFETEEKGHGRKEIRGCHVFTDISELRAKHPKWETVRAIVRLDSKREIKGKNEEETRYYLLSQNLSAEKALAAIRSHWGIENKVHWILDVAFGEDQCKIRKGNAPQNLAIMRHMALNLLKILKKNTPKLKRISIKQMRKMAGWNAHFLKKILAQTFS